MKEAKWNSGMQKGHGTMMRKEDHHGHIRKGSTVPHWPTKFRRTARAQTHSSKAAFQLHARHLPNDARFNHNFSQAQMALVFGLPQESGFRGHKTSREIPFAPLPQGCGYGWGSLFNYRIHSHWHSQFPFSSF